MLGRMGIFVNIIPLVANINSKMTGMDFLIKLQHQIAESTKNANCSLTEITRQSLFPNNIPLFDIVAGYQRRPVGNTYYQLTHKSGLETEDLEMFYQTHYSLTVMMYDNYSQFLFNDEHYTNENIKQMACHWHTLMEQIIDNYCKPLATLKLFQEGNFFENTTISKPLASPVPKNIVQCFEEQVLLRTNQIALIYNEEKMTYFQLNEKANQLAHFLLKKENALNKIIG